VQDDDGVAVANLHETGSLAPLLDGLLARFHAASITERPPGPVDATRGPPPGNPLD
jgi:hypothetical protein